MVFRSSSEYWIADPTLTPILRHSQKGEIKSLVDNSARSFVAHSVPHLHDMQKKSITYTLLAVLCVSVAANFYFAAERTSTYSISGVWEAEKSIHQWRLAIEEKNNRVYGTITYWSDHSPVIFEFEGKKINNNLIQFTNDNPKNSWAYLPIAEILAHRNELGAITHLEDRTNDLFFIKQTSLNQLIRWLR